MSLKNFFGSRTRVKLMSHFLLHPKNEYFIRELTRTLSEQINSIRRELDNLKKVGMLKVHSKNRRKYYSVNPDFEYLDDFQNIFTKDSRPGAELVSSIKKVGTVDYLLLAGQFVGDDKAGTDMLIIGNVDKNKLRELLETEVALPEKVRFTTLTRADFLYRLDCKDKFVLDLLKSEQKEVAVNKLEKYIDARVKAAA